MTETEITQYLQEKDRERYVHDKDVQKTIRWAILSILAAFLAFITCATAIACCYMYFVVPAEEETAVIDNGSKAVIQSTLDNGSNVWQ